MATHTTTTTSTSTSPVVADADDATIKTLLASFLHNPALLESFHVPRFKLRLATIRAWGVREGDHLLDIGCGQGESSVALAALVGDRGHVTAIDTASMDYGHPFTMRAAHDHLRQSALGPRVTFHQADAQSFFAEQQQTAPRLDAAVLCQSLFYFPGEHEVRALFATLRAAGTSPVYVAEWSYVPSREAQTAHALAATAQRLFYRYRYRPEAGREDPREQNVRGGVDKSAILRAAAAAGYGLAREALITPEEDMREGEFEVRFTLGEVFRQRVAEAELSGEQRAEIVAAIEKLEAEMKKELYKDGTGIMSMDVWAAVFELDK
ncbi:hypothetical protein ISF_01656 [Cordyceps fumosorosea ARSEF 2679]|uniref:Methyltransferase domain-containing protein n=1 Tax=Cordyceps fumosorosea (strain ARSEF 2679) TaxID=1081104 RepID=A0A168DGD0_CORFA|nr:hypothetical protein ISF_01656 [Cordyceps fumosorosea ARSEF 2679]OAA72583.1 hypothetical protein ISF_01656 [Cordyceps fumosorosea ARSEF 2679]